MVGKIFLIAAILVGAASGRMASSPPMAAGARGCPGQEAGLETAGSTSPAARGRGLAAVHRDALVMLGPSGDRRMFRHPGRPGLMRHAASHPGMGTAYVNDVAGPDVLVVMRPTGVKTIEGRGELTHPAWTPSGQLAWAVNLSAVEVWSPATGARRLVPPPRGAAGIFSPVFITPSKLVAIVQEPVGQTHDDGLNDLWRYDLDSSTWSRLTRFRADLDRWSVLRTPVVAPDGSVFFVRVSGRASTTELPSFELWVLREGRAWKLRDLPGEMYLAGILGGRVVWNVPDESTGEWRLVLEGARGAESLGCGAVSVDPVTEPDPDLLQARGKLDGPVDGEPSEGPDTRETAQGLALLIGDFSSDSAARALGEDLRIPGARVVGHGDAPAAVQSEAWAVVVPIPSGTSPEQALAEFRARRPELAGGTWIVPFDHAEVSR